MSATQDEVADLAELEVNERLQLRCSNEVRAVERRAAEPVRLLTAIRGTVRVYNDYYCTSYSDTLAWFVIHFESYQ